MWEELSIQQRGKPAVLDCVGLGEKVEKTSQGMTVVILGERQWGSEIKSEELGGCRGESTGVGGEEASPVSVQWREVWGVESQVGREKGEFAFLAYCGF